MYLRTVGLRVNYWHSSDFHWSTEGSPILASLTDRLRSRDCDCDCDRWNPICYISKPVFLHTTVHRCISGASVELLLDLDWKSESEIPSRGECFLRDCAWKSPGVGFLPCMKDTYPFYSLRCRRCLPETRLDVRSSTGLTTRRPLGEVRRRYTFRA